MKKSSAPAISPPVPSRLVLFLLTVLVVAVIAVVAAVGWNPVFAVVGTGLVIWGYFGVWAIGLRRGHVTPVIAADRWATEASFEQYVRTAAASDPASEIAKAKQLLDNGTISQAEFEAIKAKALG